MSVCDSANQTKIDTSYIKQYFFLFLIFGELYCEKN